MVNMFILCTEVIIVEHYFVGFILNMVVFVKQTSENLFSSPHDNLTSCHVPNEQKGSSKTSTMTSYPLENSVHDVTVLALLSPSTHSA